MDVGVGAFLRHKLLEVEAVMAPLETLVPAAAASGRTSAASAGWPPNQASAWSF